MRSREAAVKAAAPRTSGVLLHPTSLPTPFLCGDLGRGARNFVGWLKAAGFSHWQMLPVAPVGEAYSPYSSVSAFAGEELLISLEDLAADGILPRAALAAAKRESRSRGTGKQSTRVDYARATRIHCAALDAAFVHTRGDRALTRALNRFAATYKAWIDDFALFRTLAQHHRTSDWTTWPEGVATRDPRTLAQAQTAHHEKCQRWIFGQFLFAEQWARLRKHAHAHGISLIGDIPIFVSHESADVWSAQMFFKLDARGKPVVVAGCPPDRFNPDGQRWGNALYDWTAMTRDKFRWWEKRFAHTLTMFDVVRLDHFIGFHRAWEIPASSPTARKGKWQLVPGQQMFEQVIRSIGRLPLIAEDLGLVTPEVTALREAFAFPGMRIVQFGFSSGADAPHHAPHNYTENSVAYSGTHDMHTARGYVDRLQKERRNKSSAEELRRLTLWLGQPANDPAGLGQAICRATLASASELAILQAQDLLSLDDKARMNVPGTTSGNWNWRLSAGALQSPDQTARSWKDLNEVYARTRS